VAYIGVMGPQDGVDNVVRVADIIVNKLGRRDIGFVLIGSGDSFDELVDLRDRLGLAEFVEFTGRVPDATVAAILSTADVGISPDPENQLNEFCTMNKTMEYMAFGLPVVAFDLRETRVSAADAALYATPNDVGELTRLVVELIDDEPRRQLMGMAGRTRVEQELAWSHQAARYLGVYEHLIETGTDAPREHLSA
jgi:glycosyltransferase involved in cell wall biosynthesis